MKHDNEIGLHDEATEEREAAESDAFVRPSLQLDLDRYQSEIADLDLTQDQEREFLETLWTIMSAFVRLGYETDICGAIFGEFNSASGSLPDALDSKGSKNHRGDAIERRARGDRS